MKNSPCFTLLLLAMISVTSCQENHLFETSIDESMLMNYGWSSDVSSELTLYDEDDPELNYTREITTLYFLGNGLGIIKQFQHYADTYFGTGNRETPYGFEYAIDGKEVIIYMNGSAFRHRLEGDYLVSSGSRYERHSISSSEREWIEENKYRILPDDERLDINFFATCSLSSFWPPIKDGNVTKYPVDIAIGIEKDQHAWERGISSIEAYFSLSGGSWTKTPKLSAGVVKGEDCEAFGLVYITTSSIATVTMRIRIYDSVNKKYLEYTRNFNIPGDKR